MQCHSATPFVRCALGQVVFAAALLGLAAETWPQSLPTVVVTIDNAPIQSGSDVLARVRRGERLTLLETQGEWLKVNGPGLPRPGWIHQGNIRAAAANSAAGVPAAAGSGNNDARLKRALELNTESVRLFNQQKYRQALPLLREAYQIRLAILGERHLDTIICIHNMGVSLSLNGDDAAARPYAEKAWKLRQELLGEEHELAQMSLDNLCYVLESLGDYAAARPLFEKQAALTRQTQGPKHAKTATALHNLGELLAKVGDVAAARRALEEALAIRRETFGEEHAMTAVSWNELGLVLSGAHDLAAAQPCYERALAIRRKLHGEQHPETATAQSNLGLMHLKAGNFATAAQHLEQALAIRRQTLGERHSLTAASWNNLSGAREGQGDYQATKHCLEQALAIQTHLYGDSHQDLLAPLNNMAGILSRMGDHAAAVAYGERCLRLSRQIVGENHPKTLITLDNLGSLYQKMGKFPQARACKEQSLTMFRKTLGEMHPDTAKAYQSLGSLLNDLGEYAAAQRYCQQALSICEEVYGRKHPTTADMTITLANLMVSQGDYAAARPCYERALAIVRSTHGDNHPDTATAYQNLGAVLSYLGDDAASRASHEQALTIRRQVLGENHPDTSRSYYNLGLLMDGIGDYQAALDYHQKALAIRRAAFGDKHPDTAKAYSGAAASLRFLGDSAAAQPLYAKALAARIELFGEQHPDTATALEGLAEVADDLGDSAIAQKYYQRALAARSKSQGQGHPDVADTLDQLAHLSYYAGNYREAAPHARRALAIRQQVLGEDHPDTSRSRNQIGMLLAAEGQWREAAESLDIDRRQAARRALRMLATLSESEQLAYLNKFNAEFTGTLSLGWRRRDDEQIAALSAGWLINGKAQAHEALARRSQLTSPAAVELIGKLRAVRDRLSRLSLETASPGLEKTHQEQLASARRQEEQLSRQLGDLTLGDTAGNGSWVSVEKVRESLPAEATLVAMARFRVYNFQPQDMQNRWQPARYAAWIVPPAGRGSVAVVDLGAAEAVDTLVRQAREAIAAGPRQIVEEGEAAAEQAVRTPLRRLAQQVFAPLMPHLGDCQQLVLSPDGLLWLAPWAALPLVDDRYAVERFDLRFAISGRELVRQPNESVISETSVVLADPAFDRRGNLQDNPVTWSLAQRGARELADLPQFARLPATAAEARAIAPRIAQFAGVAPQVFVGDNATEHAFKSLRAPRVLTLSTHGFFLMDASNEPSNERSNSAKANSTRLENPLLRCGLALAGCNQRGTVDAAGDDGILTGLEIVGVPLQGTELVVLSACETGVGEVRNGEGVAGLRQAFQLAGARSVMASLWQVPDADTARLMSEFFKYLADGKSKSAALRAAQLQQIANHRKQEQAAHPFFWAAFTLTGQ